MTEFLFIIYFMAWKLHYNVLKIYIYKDFIAILAWKYSLFEPMSLVSPALAGGFFSTGATWRAHIQFYVCLCVCACVYMCIWIFLCDMCVCISMWYVCECMCLRVWVYDVKWADFTLCLCRQFPEFWKDHKWWECYWTKWRASGEASV